MMRPPITRENTLDDYIIREQAGYRLLPMSGRTVLDIGANIGAFARYAVSAGASEVICVEPEADNFELLLRNTAELPVRSLRAAVMPDDRETVELYVNGKQNKGLHSTVPTRGRRSVTVPCVEFESLLPLVDSVKCDIEGGEYLLPWDRLPDRVTGLAMELHLTHHGHRDEAQRLISRLSEWGWRAVRQPQLGAKNWTALGIWVR